MKGGGTSLLPRTVGDTSINHQKPPAAERLNSTAKGAGSIKREDPMREKLLKDVTSRKEMQRHTNKWKCASLQTGD